MIKKIGYSLVKSVLNLLLSVIFICVLLALIPDITADNYALRFKSYFITAVTFNYDISLARGFYISELVIDASQKTFLLIFVTLITVIMISLVIIILESLFNQNYILQIIVTVIKTISTLPVLIWASLLIFFAFIIWNAVPVYADLESDSLWIKTLVIALPVISLSLGDGMLMDFYLKIKNELSSLNQQQWVKSLRARGISTLKHKIRSLIVPIFNLVSSKITYLISGSIIVEYIFSWQGLGFLIWQVLMTPGAKDYPLLLACCKVLLITVIIISLIRDYIDFTLNPHLIEK